MSLLADVPAPHRHEPGAAVGTVRVELDVYPIDGDGWRVSIRGADRGNPFALLGFISRSAGPAGPQYLVCVIGQPGAELAAGSLDEAVELLRPELGEVEAILSGARH
ncbi:MAG: hypothetical protein FWD85_06855 [Microbacteriaceae bacterium]|nr:hypothetical protein [Microbacteriaceae bacterium]MCL2795010.1 hypothetical protein [Microbacteriaceae bacterium]